MTKEEQVLDKALGIIDKALDGDSSNQNAVYVATDLIKNGISYLMNQRIEKERVRMEVWSETITNKDGEQ